MRLLITLIATVLPLIAEPAGGLWIVAHRGANKIAPENTIAAFEAAAHIGAEYMEVDVRPTFDGELVLMHDEKVDRTTNGHGAVKELLFADIRKLDAGNGQEIPTFRETLLWAKKRGVMIDVDHKAGEPAEIAKVIHETQMTKRVVIESSREMLIQFAELLPGVDTMPKVRSIDEIGAVCRSLHTTVIRLTLEQLANPQAVSAVRQCGARVSVTILGKTDNEEDIRRVVDLGAQLIETDHPEIVAKVRASSTAK